MSVPFKRKCKGGEKAPQTCLKGHISQGNISICQFEFHKIIALLVLFINRSGKIQNLPSRIEIIFRFSIDILLFLFFLFFLVVFRTSGEGSKINRGVARGSCIIIILFVFRVTREREYWLGPAGRYLFPHDNRSKELTSC
jgi:hypothetical protein